MLSCSPPPSSCGILDIYIRQTLQFMELYSGRHPDSRKKNIACRLALFNRMRIPPTPPSYFSSSHLEQARWFHPWYLLTFILASFPHLLWSPLLFALFILASIFFLENASSGVGRCWILPYLPTGLSSDPSLFFFLWIRHIPIVVVVFVAHFTATNDT